MRVYSLIDGYCKYCKRDITEEITTVRNWDRIAVLVAYHM